MTTAIFLLSLLQALSVSLGVGSSTLAIINFFVAIADGKIDDTERKMMGVVYSILRLAMVLILITTLSLVAIEVLYNGLVAMNAWIWAVLTTVAVLFINATLMTLRVMPSTFGPSLQAGSWYALATLFSVAYQGYDSFPYLLFLLCYVTWLVLVVGIVNGIMGYLRAHRHNSLK